MPLRLFSKSSEHNVKYQFRVFVEVCEIPDGIDDVKFLWQRKDQRGRTDAIPVQRSCIQLMQALDVTGTVVIDDATAVAARKKIMKIEVRTVDEHGNPAKVGTAWQAKAAIDLAVAVSREFMAIHVGEAAMLGFLGPRLGRVSAPMRPPLHTGAPDSGHAKN